MVQNPISAHCGISKLAVRIIALLDEGMDSESAQLLGNAARLLGGEELSDVGEAGQAEAVLRALGYRNLAEPEKAQACRLLRAGSYVGRIFQIESEDSPGLHLIGGEADPAVLGLSGEGLPKASLTGSGPDLRDALEACLGEGVEYLSQIEREDDVVVSGGEDPECASLPESVTEIFLNRLTWSPDARGGAIDWIAGTRLGTGERCLIPADLVLRRAPNRSGFSSRRVPASVGCAAGQSSDHALLGALLELVERDAVAHWWVGGKRGRPIDPSVLEASDVENTIGNVRSKSNARRSWFLDISARIDVPVVVAVSLQCDGTGFAIGLGAHPEPAVAVRKAFNELCQSEAAYQVVDAKEAALGPAALNPVDLNHRRRRDWAHARDDPALKPHGECRRRSCNFTGWSARTLLSHVVGELERQSVSIFAVDLTRRDFNVPVMWAGTPDLVPFPCEPATGAPTATTTIEQDRPAKLDFSLM